MANDILVVLRTATLDHDQRTGKPVLKLRFTEASRDTLRGFGADNVGQKVEFRVAGRAMMTPVLREPMIGTTQIISDNSWTDETVTDLARQFSSAPNGEIELRSLSGSN